MLMPRLMIARKKPSERIEVVTRDDGREAASRYETARSAIGAGQPEIRESFRVAPATQPSRATTRIALDGLRFITKARK
jgi:hypothetical protein